MYVTQTTDGYWTIQCQLLDPEFNPPMQFSLTVKTLVLAAGTLGELFIANCVHYTASVIIACNCDISFMSPFILM